MIDIFAVILICSVDCVTIHDRLSEYQTIEECVQDIPNLQEDYKTNLVTCHEGNIIEDDFTVPTLGA